MAAAVPVLPGAPQTEIDWRCNYRSFRQRHDGKVPCLAIGQDLAGNVNDVIGEVTGVLFQKVDLGIVRAVFPNDDFAQIDWPNAPTHDPQPGPNLLLGAPPQAVPPIWQEFATTMLHTRDEMLARMTVPGVPPPTSLLKGIHKSLWLVGNNVCVFSEVDTEEKLEAIKNAAGAGWSNNRHIYNWAYDIVDGLNGATTFCSLFDTLFPDSQIPEQKVLVAAPPETSKNKTIRHGVVHCLTYGFYKDQVDEVRHPRPRRRNEYVSNRILIGKKLGNRARSRSRSPVSDNDDITEHVRDVTVPPRAQLQPITIHDMLQNPPNFVLKSQSFHNYFEPHKPDFLFCSISTIEKESEEVAGVVNRSREYSVKLIIEISSQQKFQQTVSLKKHLEHTTEQCVQQCLSGMNANQDKIYGLTIVPDGLKLIKINRRQNPTTYLVSETELVTWNQTQNIYAMLQMIDNILQ
ncbi:uncharacterized protein [Amphiura filiformis]|uniref:uncharacterized protein n=1 Tax=Amphiura filiformis TaxID=82378 RepID=UPI003B218485